MNSIQTNLFEQANSKAQQYHEDSPHLYEAFERFTFQAIAKGFNHYGAHALTLIIRWHTPLESNTGEYKINNNMSAFYGRLFEKNHPQHKGFFRKRRAKCDEDF